MGLSLFEGVVAGCVGVRQVNLEPIRRKSGAHRLEMFGLFFSPCYLFSEGNVCQHQ